MMRDPIVIWMVVSALLNIALRFRTTEQWISYCERHPWGAFLVRTIRALGIDPVKAIQALADALDRKGRR